MGKAQINAATRRGAVEALDYLFRMPLHKRALFAWKLILGKRRK